MTSELELTDEQKTALLAEFSDWSGGCAPEETTPEDRETFITHAADATLPEEALRRVLFQDQQR